MKICGACCVLLTLAMHRPASAEDFRPHMSADVAVSWTEADWFAQTPAGGRPGTSDIRRPDSDELDMHDTLLYDFGVQGFLGRSRIYAGAHWIRLSGEGTLEEPLVTRERFPAGTSFDAYVQYDWYDLGISRMYVLGRSRVRWQPRVELALLTFAYRFDSPDQSVGRSYGKLAVRMGVDVNMQLGGKTALVAAADGSLPSYGAPQITTGNILLQRTLSESFKRWEVAAFAGAGFVYIDREDSQELPNHVRFEAMPRYVVGLAVGM